MSFSKKNRENGGGKFQKTAVFMLWINLLKKMPCPGRCRIEDLTKDLATKKAQACKRQALVKRELIPS